MQNTLSPRKNAAKKKGFSQAFFLLIGMLCVCLPSCTTVEEDASPPAQVEAPDELPVLFPHEMLPDIEEEGEEEPAATEAEIESQEEEIEEPPPPEEEPEPPLEDAHEVVAIVNDVVITRQEHLQTKSEIESVVDELNQITQQRNYSRWLSYLDDDYKRTLSDQAYLAQVSNSLPKALRDRRVRLTTLKDYFEYVFVPSRQNMRVDDIQYITPTRVYVIMELARGQRAAIYILEKQNGENWKLVDKNE